VTPHGFHPCYGSGRLCDGDACFQFRCQRLAEGWHVRRQVRCLLHLHRRFSAEAGVRDARGGSAGDLVGKVVVQWADFATSGFEREFPLAGSCKGAQGTLLVKVEVLGKAKVAASAAAALAPGTKATSGAAKASGAAAAAAASPAQPASEVAAAPPPVPATSDPHRLRVTFVSWDLESQAAWLSFRTFFIFRRHSHEEDI
jgi:hypothetical protein